jgi:hypothetical protein
MPSRPVCKAPISDLQLGLRVIDADNRPMQAPDLLSQYRADHRLCSGIALWPPAPGLCGGHGSAAAEHVPLTAQYWNGQGFIANRRTTAPTLATPNLTFFAQTADNQLASGDTTASFNAAGDGNRNLRLSAPGAGNFGYFWMSAFGAGLAEVHWDGVDQGGDGNLLDDDPRARAAFGKQSPARWQRQSHHSAGNLLT